jgi:ArsR family transcriptional regulator
MVYDLTRAIKALSDETRLRILNLLLERECCVCEVMQALGISETRASRNLRILYDAGLLKLRKEGLWSLYSINQADAPEYFAELVKAVKEALAGNQQASQDRERLRMAERIGPTCVRQKLGG